MGPDGDAVTVLTRIGNGDFASALRRADAQVAHTDIEDPASPTDSAW